MITTDDAELAERMRLFRTHGITRDPKCFSSLTSLARRSHDAKAADL
jgi:dTDP-4-amino-4,6-dideoxygalactose transaminase